MNIKLKLVVGIGLLLSYQACLAELIFYPLLHKTPAELTQPISELLQPGETVIAGPNELILRLEPQHVEEIKSLIDRLDQPSHRLLIYVSHQRQLNQQSQGYDGQAQLQAGLSNKPSLQGGIKVYRTRDTENDQSKQSIQVLEGHTAYISTGVSQPNITTDIIQHDSHAHISSNTYYKEHSSGFYITPRLSKDSVILDMSPWSGSAPSHDGTSNFNRASTVIRSRLNTWTELSNANQWSEQGSSKILGQTNKATKNSNSIWIKVVDLDTDLNN
ncbi:MAG: nodulation protein NolW [Cycloclasticus sp.]|nr:nodulation protein NolW [Cycloclasticus sp.]